MITFIIKTGGSKPVTLEALKLRDSFFRPRLHRMYCRQCVGPDTVITLFEGADQQVTYETTPCCRHFSIRIAKRLAKILP